MAELLTDWPIDRPTDRSNIWMDGWLAGDSKIDHWEWICSALKLSKLISYRRNGLWSVQHIHKGVETDREDKQRQRPNKPITEFDFCPWRALLLLVGQIIIWQPAEGLLHKRTSAAQTTRCRLIRYWKLLCTGLHEFWWRHRGYRFEHPEWVSRCPVQKYLSLSE